jgi:hypothetical protein
MDPKTLQAANRDVDKTPPSPCQDCKDVVHLAFFFDGTGNNLQADNEKRKWSNVARLFMSARNIPSQAIYRIYISGVGTRFNGEVGAVRSAWTWVQDKTLGNFGGAGGDQRMDYGQEQMNEQLKKTLLELAKKSTEKNEAESFDELNKALGKHRLIKFINISIFGFSRGAALARAFTNRLAATFKSDGNGGHTLEGYPVRLVFQGVWDTVASFGVPTANFNHPWSERDLKVPGSELLEKCVHFVAGHELRYSFPVDLARENGHYKDNVTEIVYPGVHSDVGGGYEPDKQARSDNLARIALFDMHSPASRSGVRLKPIVELQAKDIETYERFEIHKETREAYAAYKKALGTASGTIEAQMKKHMQVFYAAYGTLHRNGGSKSSDKANAERLAKAQAELKTAQIANERWMKRGPTNSAEVKQMTQDTERYEAAQNKVIAAKKDVERMTAAGDDIAGQAVALADSLEKGKIFGTYKGNFTITYDVQQWMLDAWRSTVDPAVCNFFENYIHDSRTDFLSGSEPFTYFNMRGVHEQTKSVAVKRSAPNHGPTEEGRKNARATTRERAGIHGYKEPK